MIKRTIFIWDIHWCYKELKLLLKKLNIQEKDKIYFVGDYINKGPKSFKVVKFLYKNWGQYKWVLWNHDQYFFKAVENWQKLSKEEKKLLKKLKDHPKIFEFYKNLPLYIEKDDFILLHWGKYPKKKLKEHTAEEITNLRVIKKKPWHHFYTWEKKIIYGHWAMQWICIKQNTIWIDSSCCYWGFLTAYILETGELIQQGSLKQYAKIDYSHINPVFQ